MADVFVTILKPIAEFIGTVVCDVVEAVFKVLESLWINILEPIANFLIDIFAEALKGVIEIWEAWKPVIDLIFDGLKWLWDNMLKPFVNFIADRLIKTFERWGPSVRETIGIVKNIFSGLIDFIVGVFTGDWSRAWEGVKKIFGSIFEGIGKLAKRPINGIINIVNTLIRGLNKIHLPDWVPVIGGKGINLPEIPKLAKGGIVDSATLAVVGEAGKEAVMPLENNTGWITQLAEKVASRMPQNSTNSDNPITLKFDFTVGTLKFAKTICTSLNELGENNGGVIPINI
ncbi:hypothetical protein LI064_01930 [Clostridium perfringens]|nr:hypothetical protein [Clostridium perfringens]